MSGLEARAPNPTLLLPDALQLHVVPIKRETARVGDMHGFQRDDDIVASEIDRARARVALTILPGELSASRSLCLRQSHQAWRRGRRQIPRAGERDSNCELDGRRYAGRY